MPADNTVTFGATFCMPDPDNPGDFLDREVEVEIDVHDRELVAFRPLGGWPDDALELSIDSGRLLHAIGLSMLAERGQVPE